eukprot:547193_1
MSACRSLAAIILILFILSITFAIEEEEEVKKEEKCSVDGLDGNACKSDTKKNQYEEFEHERRQFAWQNPKGHQEKLKNDGSGTSSSYHSRKNDRKSGVKWQEHSYKDEISDIPHSQKGSPKTDIKTDL